MVPQSNRCEDRDRVLPTSVQRGTTTLKPRDADADGVQAEVVINQDAGRSPSLGSNGPKKAGRSLSPLARSGEYFCGSRPRSSPMWLLGWMRFVSSRKLTSIFWLSLNFDFFIGISSVSIARRFHF